MVFGMLVWRNRSEGEKIVNEDVVFSLERKG